MLTPRIRKTANSAYLLPPLKGWNPSQHPFSMDDSEASLLDNFVIEQGEVRVRYGIDNLVNISGGVETLFNFKDVRHLCATPTKIVDITNPLSPTDKATGMGSGLYSSATYKDLMFMVNGVDAARVYDGSTITTTGFTDFTAVPTFVAVAHNRVFFAPKDTLSFDYGDAGAIAGALTNFALNGYCRKGGKIIAIGTWTRDGGNGMEDLTVFITSMGEVIVYQGTDPDDVANWSLVGVYEAAQPMNNRCLLKWGGELMYLSKDGWQPLSSALSEGRTSPRGKISDKIRKALKQSIITSNYWQAHFAPDLGLIYINVPIITGQNCQFVLSLDSNVWTSYSGLHARCFGNYQSKVYYGTSIGVTQAEVGYNDNGSVISAKVLTGNLSIGNKGSIKQFTWLKPIIETNGTMQPLVQLDIDYAQKIIYGNASLSQDNSSLWDVAEWDVTPWGVDKKLSPILSGAGGVGRTAALRMTLSSQFYPVKWLGTEILYNTGGTSFN